MSRSLNTETIRRMDREELTEELGVLGVRVDEDTDDQSDDYRSDDQLRDDLCSALEAGGDPAEARGDYMRDQAKDRGL